MALARIGLLVFGSVWPKWKGLPRSIRATHPDILPSTTKHSNRCELDGVDRITGQHRDSTECHIILLVSSAQFSRVELSFGTKSEFQWNGAAISVTGAATATHLPLLLLLLIAQVAKSHMSPNEMWDVPRVAGNCALNYCPRSHPIASAS